MLRQASRLVLPARLMAGKAAAAPTWLRLPPRALSSAAPTVRNPLLDVEATTAISDAASDAASGRAVEVCAVANVKNLPVSSKKLRHVANLAQGLYWREAMLQMEFCRKNIAVFVKNAVAQAARDAEEQHGLDPTLLVVHQAAVGKGTYRKGLDYKSKGRVGTRKKYASHLYVVLKQVTPDMIERTRHYGRWRATAKLLSVPWEERVAELPRYKPIPGYEPGEPRVRPALALMETNGDQRRAARARRAARSKGYPGGALNRVAQ